jgi:hypothetical protein
MSNPRHLFSSEYTKGSVTSSEEAPTLQTGGFVKVPILTAEQQAANIPRIDTTRYGTGKPRRIIIRGRISGG